MNLKLPSYVFAKFTVLAALCTFQCRAVEHRVFCLRIERQLHPGGGIIGSFFAGGRFAGFGDFGA